MTAEIQKAMRNSARGVRPTKAEVRELWKPERPRKRSASYERDLTNFSRKLDWHERIALAVLAERLALRSIRRARVRRSA